MYQNLLNGGNLPNNYPDLVTQWDEIKNHFSAPISMDDPHIPKSPFLKDECNPTGKLDYDETYALMENVVRILLDTPLRSLGNKSLRDVGQNFSSDELERDQFLKTPIPPTQGKMRNRIAAARLAANKQLISP